MKPLPIVTLALQRDPDVVTARSRARLLAELLGFERQDQVRIGTAVSELARNAVRYAGGGSARFALLVDPPTLLIDVSDRGPGIADVAAILDGSYVSRTGMGIGLTGTRRLMDRFELTSQPGVGTRVTIGKLLPGRAPSADEMATIGRRLADAPTEDPLTELTRQNHDLIRALSDLRTREEDLQRVNRELEDTNRGVVALYAELDQRAAELKRASDVKSRFFSFMSHEFRTPVNSILALSRMLLDRMDGELTSEQEKQVTFIRRSADGLAELVNDLLDLAKAEAGRIEPKATRFTVEELLGGLKGVLRPLIPAGAAVALVVVDDAQGALDTDEAKLTQILRNLVSNALKFTEAGEVRLRAQALPDQRIEFTVSDTGIGIPAEHLESIFHEFSQVDQRLQGRARGTGLGLPLSRKLAGLLGGTLEVASTPGQGSLFTLVIPRRLPGGTAEPPAATAADGEERGQQRILLIDDDAVWRYVVRGLLADLPLEVFEAENGADGLDVARVVRPAAIFLDLAMPVKDGFETYAELRRDPELHSVPVVICSSRNLSTHERDRLAGAAAMIDKVTRSQAEDLAKIDGALAQAGLGELGRGSGA